MTTRGSITIDPQGATVSVDVLLRGVRPTVYAAATGSSTMSLPVEISTVTHLWVARREAYTVIVSLNDEEVLRQDVGVGFQAAHDPTVLVSLAEFTTGEANASFGGGGGGVSPETEYEALLPLWDGRTLTLQELADQGVDPILEILDANGNVVAKFDTGRFYKSIGPGRGYDNFTADGLTTLSGFYGYTGTGSVSVGVVFGSDRLELAGGANGVLIAAKSAAPTDAHLQEGRSEQVGGAMFTVWVDESGNKLKFRVLYANGTTFKSGEIALT